jgi:uncharacterized membrane-anchored protein
MVPEIIAVGWFVKILTTQAERPPLTSSDVGDFGGGGTEVALFLVAVELQFATRRYRAFAQWFLACAIAHAGIGLSDFLYLGVHIRYARTTALWAALLAGVFGIWYHNEGTLSIHSITTQRREAS